MREQKNKRVKLTWRAVGVYVKKESKRGNRRNEKEKKKYKARRALER